MAGIDIYLRHLVENSASDLHLSAGARATIRKYGDLIETPFEQVTNDTLKTLLFEILTEEQQDIFIENKELDFAYEIPEVSRFRVNYFYHRQGIGAAFRTIPTSIPTLYDLGLPLQILRFTNLNKGLVLVTGPTGSGKSTTIATIIDHINSNKKLHIISIEDPIEFIHKDKKCIVNQREVGSHTRSFANALRSALREDPDLILIGEMRDLETIELAITAAETGHLVFATLHTNSAAKTVDRIIDAFPAKQQSQIRTMLSGSLKGIISQELLKRVDKIGRLAAIEILFCNFAVANLIRENKTYQLPSLIQAGRGQGMQLMDQVLMDLLKQNKISAEDAYLKANDKKPFEELLNASERKQLVTCSF
ncbi:MAG: type IV pilus twitching motility protein PilT [Nitrospirae bacterium]|nr:type IV pilus twitching motility protein PilT [Nitrospirota bacterium]